MCTPTPDTSKADATGDKLATLSTDQFNWVKQQYEAQAPDRKAASDRANTVSDLNADLMRREIALGDEAAGNYRSIYQPLEQKQARDAAEYDTEAHAAELAGKAQADVQHSFGTARAAQDSNMASMGLNPDDGRYDAAGRDLQREQALAEAGARTKARTDASTMGRALVADAIGTGRGVIGNQATTAGIAINAGGAAAGTAALPLQYGQSGVNMVQNGANGAVNGLSTAGNIYSRSSELSSQQAQSNSAGMGSLAAAGMTAAALF